MLIFGVSGLRSPDPPNISTLFSKHIFAGSGLRCPDPPNKTKNKSNPSRLGRGCAAPTRLDWFDTLLFNDQL